jgi:hypothetical protein
MNHIKETIADLEQHLEKLRIDAAAIERVLVILQKKDCPKTVPSPAQKADPIKKPKRKVGKKKSRKSKYKGVIIMENANGTVRFRANYWDAKKKKTKHLGAFDNELEAASAVERALGNTEEADRLFLLTGIRPKIRKAVEKYY